MHRLMATAIGLGVLFLALVASSTSVGAIDPSIFTNNGCAVGNYACLQAAAPSIFANYGCPVGNYSCLQAALGYPTYPYYYRPYVYPYPAAYYQPNTYVIYNPYMYATQPATTTTATATIVSGRVVTTGQQVVATIDGFTAGETVTASVTGPNGQSLQIGSAPAAQDSSVTVTLSFPSTGTWQLTVHGQTSNKNVVNSYTVK
jgi:hypothetical protein